MNRNDKYSNLLMLFLTRYRVVAPVNHWQTDLSMHPPPRYAWSFQVGQTRGRMHAARREPNFQGWPLKAVPTHWDSSTSIRRPRPWDQFLCCKTRGYLAYEAVLR